MLQPTFAGHESTPEGPAVSPEARGPIHLFTFGSPMGRKCQIALESLREVYGDSITWTWERVPLPKRVQKSPWYLELNPDGRIPMLVDSGVIDLDTGEPGYLTESGAILTHLFDKYDPDHAFTFSTEFERHDMLRWIFFSNSALGAAQARANHFCNLRKSGEINRVGLDLFNGEVHRLYTILEDRMSGRNSAVERDWIAGRGRGRFSVADIDLFPWIYIHAKFGIMTTDEFDERYPQLRRWLDRCWAREAVRRGIEGYDP